MGTHRGLVALDERDGGNALDLRAAEHAKERRLGLGLLGSVRRGRKELVHARVKERVVGVGLLLGLALEALSVALSDVLERRGVGGRLLGGVADRIERQKLLHLLA